MTPFTTSLSALRYPVVSDDDWAIIIPSPRSFQRTSLEKSQKRDSLSRDTHTAEAPRVVSRLPDTRVTAHPRTSPRHRTAAASLHRSATRAAPPHRLGAKGF